MASTSALLRRPLVGDAAVAGAAAAFGIFVLALDLEERGASLSVGRAAIVVIASSFLVVRRHRPLLVMAATVILRLIATPVLDSEIALVPAVAVAFFTVAYQGERRWAITTAVGAAIASTSVILLLDPGDPVLPELLGEAAATLMPVAVGDALRSRQDRVTLAIEAEAEARVQAERLRIARDLHDVVAHALSIIAIQSGVAAHELDDTEPNRATRLALERINETGRGALDELRDMLGVLRSTDEAPLRPAPTDPDDFSDLTATAALAGIDLRIEVDGRFPAEARDSVIVATHRIALEAVTNVARHAGPVPTSVEIDHRDDRVALRILNTTSTNPPPSESSGVGIIGMRERAETLGGTFEARPIAGGGFEVRTEIPHRAAPR